jgi:CubicO group peptidase (beta-lactamase class C family)
MKAKTSSSIDRRRFIELTALGGGVILVGSFPGCGPRTAGSDSATALGGGFSQAGLANLHDLMAAHVASGKVPGLVTLVSRRGQVEVDAIGNKTLGGQDPMTRDAIFRIASMSKAVTAAAAMILIEEGKIRLEEPVDRLLPELANRRVLKSVDGPLDDTVPAKRAITVDDLMTFRMGFGLMFPMDTRPIQKKAIELGVLFSGAPLPKGSPEPNEWLKRFATLPLMAQPGEQWLYHTGSDILGILIARASGQDLPTFLSERIFAPLEMTDTGFSVPASKLDRLPPMYFANPQTSAMDVLDAAQTTQWSTQPGFPSGGGGLVSTADDFHSFARMLLNKGEHAQKRILSAQSVARMTSDHLTPEQKSISGFAPGFFDKIGWGFGLSVVTKPDSISAVPGRYGWLGGYGTHWFNDPSQDLVGLMLTQRTYDDTFPNVAFEKAVYAAIE